MGDTRFSLGRAGVVGEFTANGLVSGLAVTAVYNVPSDKGQVSGQAVVSLDTGGPAGKVSQLGILALIKGRVDDHRVRAFRFPLDGHDFYGLHLGEDSSVVVDLVTGQWSRWRSPNRSIWRCGLHENWTGVGAAALSTQGGRSNIVAGDDAYGLLWWVVPTQGYDQDPDDASEQAFTRTVLGGVPMRMRETLRCNEVYLTSTKGDDSLTVTAQTVSLRTSDDSAKTWTDQGSITVTADDYETEFAWRSLGVIGAPGRVFEVSDNCLARVDMLDIR